MSDIEKPAITPLVHIIRHGQSLHNIDRAYPHRDPPLTTAGLDATKQIDVFPLPDLIIISPMTRAIQTAISAFPSLLGTEVQIWPDLREAHDAICNKGVSRAQLVAKSPQFDFAKCPEEWHHHAPHSVEGATARAEAERRRLKALGEKYGSIALITHRGFIAFLVKGERFDVCEARTYRFGTEEAGVEGLRWGINVDTEERQDFGPTVLVPFEVNEGAGEENGASAAV